MSDVTKIAAAFQSILEAADGTTPPPTFRALDVDAACAEVEAALFRTVLPRRITVRSEAGSRLSVVAKNRRIIKIAEVHPSEHWAGDSSPQDALCAADDEEFVTGFVGALLKVVDDQKILIEEHFVSGDAVKKARSGYPAFFLSEHIAQVREGSTAAGPVQEFYDMHANLARARFGGDAETSIPGGSVIEKAWLDKQVEALAGTLADAGSDLRCIHLDGEVPLTIALVRHDGDGCIVIAESAGEMDDLEKHLGALRDQLET